MALRIDHLNKKFAALGIVLVRGEEEGFEMNELETGDLIDVVEGVNKINDLTEAEWMAVADQMVLSMMETRQEEDNEDDAEEEETGKMSETLSKYRAVYAKTTSYNGNHSLDNGDEVAALLRGMSPSDTCALADKVMGEAEFHHWEKWQHLNPGSRRMNAGNRIRGAVKRGDLTIEQLQDLVAGKDLIDDEAAV